MRMLRGRSTETPASKPVIQLVEFVRRHNRSFPTVVQLIVNRKRLTLEALELIIDNAHGALEPQERTRLSGIIHRLYENGLGHSGSDWDRFRGEFVEVLSFRLLPYLRPRRGGPCKRYSKVHVVDEKGRRLCDAQKTADVGFEDEVVRYRQIFECKVSVEAWFNDEETQGKLDYLECVQGEISHRGGAHCGFIGLDTTRPAQLPEMLDFVGYDDIRVRMGVS